MGKWRMATLSIWKFVTFSDRTGESIDIITFNCSSIEQMKEYIKAMGFVYSYNDQIGFYEKPNYVYEGKKYRAELQEVEGYEELL
jgi:hypothetical protein